MEQGEQVDDFRQCLLPVQDQHYYTVTSARL
jgi:hypothetical protein